METVTKKQSGDVLEVKSKIEQLLAQYREKHDELELAVEEWDIGEIQEALAQNTKEINRLKKQVRAMEDK